jgi:hypothetical protein
MEVPETGERKLVEVLWLWDWFWGSRGMEEEGEGLDLRW